MGKDSKTQKLESTGRCFETSCIDGLDTFKGNLERVLLEVLETCLVKAGKDAVVAQVVSKFPDHVNQVIDEFFHTEIMPALIAYLKDHKSHIFNSIKEGLLTKVIEDGVDRVLWKT